MLSAEEKSAFLKQGIFATLEDETLGAIAQRMGEREMEAGEELFMKGEPGDQIFIILEGEIEIHDGDYVIAVLEEGQLFGEMAVLGGGKRTASGRAKGETRLLFLKDKAIRLLIQQVPDIAFALFRILIDRLDEANRVSRHLSGDADRHGWVEVVGGQLKGKSYPVFHTEAILGRATGAVSDALKIALPVDHGVIEDHHALVTISDNHIFIEPQDGEVLIGGEAISDNMAVGPDDIVQIGELQIQLSAE